MKKLLTLTLALLLALALVACGSSSKQEQNPYEQEIEIRYENGFAYWTAPESVDFYDYGYVYYEGEVPVSVFNGQTGETSVPMHEGYWLELRPTFKDGTVGHWFSGEIYGSTENRKPLEQEPIIPDRPNMPDMPDTPDLPERLTVTVDEDGRASWNSIALAKYYTVIFVYTDENGDVAGGELETTATSVDIPYGYKIYVTAEAAEGSSLADAHTDYYGEKGKHMPIAVDNETGKIYLLAAPTVTVDENGCATWTSVEGAKEYVYHFEYMRYVYGAEPYTVRTNDMYTTDMSVQIPQGSRLCVSTVFANRVISDAAVTEPYGDVMSPEFPKDGEYIDVNFTLKWSDATEWEILSSIDLSTVRSENGKLYFTANSPDGAVRFEGTDVTLENGKLTVKPTGILVALDATGRIYTYLPKLEKMAPDAGITATGGYTFSDATSVASADDLIIADGFGISAREIPVSPISVACKQPNFAAIKGNPMQTESYTLEKLYVYYDNSDNHTKLSAVSLDETFYRAYLEGDKYDPSRESFDKAFEFYILAEPELQNMAAHYNPTDQQKFDVSLIHGIADRLFTVGDLTDKNGVPLNKATRELEVGDRLNITIAGTKTSLALPICAKVNDANTMYDLVPYGFSAGTGKVNALVIPIWWEDQPESRDDALLTRLYSELGRVKALDGTVTDYSDGLEARFSLSRYFEIASYGKLEITSFVTDWYLGGSFGDMMNSQPSREFIDRVLEWLYKTYPSVDFSEYDKDNNGYIDALIFPTFGKNDTGSFNMASFSGGVMFRDSYVDIYAGTNTKPGINSYIVANLNTIAGNLIVHEFGHTLGLIDYYDVQYSGIDAVGKYDMQSASVGDWNAYSKWSVGWITPEIIQGMKSGESRTVSIGSFAKTGDAIVIPGASAEYNGTPFDEYILIDFFTADGTNKYDAASYGLASAKGVRIYHVNAIMEGRVLTENGKEFPIGTIHEANDNDGDGNFNIEIIQSGGKNTLTNKAAVTDATVKASDFFYAGSRFDTAQYGEFFDGGKLDDGTDFGYVVEIVSITGDTATIKITKK